MPTFPPWLLDEVRAYDLEMFPPPATILDIGANVGAYTLRCSAKWPGAKIAAYEPVRETFNELLKNVGKLRQITAWDIAVRSHCGPDNIFIGDHSVTSSFHQRGRQTQLTETVHCQDAMDIPGAELVKIDTEGCEVEILERLDLERTRAVVVEYHSEADRLVISGSLATSGFKLLQAVPGSAVHGVLKFGRDPGVMVPAAAESPDREPSRLAASGQTDTREHSPAAPIGDALRAPKASGARGPIPPRKVYLAVAGHFGFNDFLFVQSMLTMLMRPQVSVQIGWSTDPSVERARNILTANFLETDCTHLLFVDTDIGFSAEDVRRISSHDEPIVGGMYPLKSDVPDVAWCGNGLQAGVAPIREDGLSQVKYIGTGFLCIRRDVFGILAAHAAVEQYRQDFPPHRQETAFWFQRVFGLRFLTEDWNFCQLCLDKGLPIYGDSRVVLRHAGRAVWPLNIQRGNPFIQQPAAKLPAA